MSARKSKVVIGWTEWVGFPDWHINFIKAKIDTGARTSALHVEDVEEVGRGRVAFDVMIGRKKPFRRKRITARVVKTANVRSSNGTMEERFYVRTTITMGGFEKEIELSLVSREKMLFRMLLGRKALEHDFVVDVSHRHVISRRVKKKKTKTKKPKSHKA